MTCAACGQALPDGALFCEACGAKVGSAAAPTVLTPPTTANEDESPISTPTAVRPPVVVEAPQARTCAECGGTVAADGYCEQCGAKAASERDHFREAPAPWLAGVCDRGIVHARNEDAMALYADPAVPGRSVVVVCDGVSSSKDSDVAALAGARAARDVLRAPLPQGLGVAESIEAAATKVFVTAAEAANTAVVAHTDLSSEAPASCTFVAAVAEGSLLRYAVIGDSRAYWLPDAGEGVQLTTDDSMAQLLMAGGMTRAQAEASPQAHAITKWLGKDSPDIVPVCGSLDATGPGWLLVCSDGLWNYASEPAALAGQLRAAAAGAAEESKADPGTLALALVEFAKACGGHDNISVALARVVP
ncbi:MAG: protein phosphatase 2C domain-containing protein [Actinobacteria bacterium]|nr:protein phosphatase 2C domain-containing protein [Actinomycetota bacterium]